MQNNWVQTKPVILVRDIVRAHIKRNKDRIAAVGLILLGSNGKYTGFRSAGGQTFGRAQSANSKSFDAEDVRKKMQEHLHKNFMDALGADLDDYERRVAALKARARKNPDESLKEAVRKMASAWNRFKF